MGHERGHERQHRAFGRHRQSGICSADILAAITVPVRIVVTICPSSAPGLPQWPLNTTVPASGRTVLLPSHSTTSVIQCRLGDNRHRTTHACPADAITAERIADPQWVGGCVGARQPHILRFDACTLRPCRRHARARCEDGRARRRSRTPRRAATFITRQCRPVRLLRRAILQPCLSCVRHLCRGAACLAAPGRV